MKIIVILIFLAFLFYLFSPNGGTSDPSPFSQTGYFKQSENRIVSVTMSGDPGAAAAKRWGRNFAYTPGHFTAVYFFNAGSKVPADGITMAKDVFAANHVLYDVRGLSKWHYAYMHSIKGIQEFSDCHKDPNSSLCRQSN